MIKLYSNGQELLDDNKELLGGSKYQSVFFYWDAPLLKRADKVNYAMKCISDGESLIAMKVEPFDLLLLGSPACCEELADYIKTEGYELKNYLCGCDVGDRLTDVLRTKYGTGYEESLAMEFMEAYACDGPSSSDVITPSPDDLDEIVDCMERFIKDCNLEDTVDRQKTAETLGSFRVIRDNGRILSMAKFVDATENDMKVMDVYTRDECRGKGLARKVVTTVTNEILSSGKTATLNVDRRNPVTNHLYRSIGYKPLFSQGEYRPANK